MSKTVKKNLVPTSDNIKDFKFAEQTSYGVECTRSEKPGGLKVFTIRKKGGYDYRNDCVIPNWKVEELSYDIVNDFIIPGYRIEYLVDPNADDLRKRYIPIPNQYLEDVTINAYVVTSTGLWYCRKNSLYYLDAKSGTNTRIGLAKNVVELELMPNGMLRATLCSDVKQTVQNRSEDYYNSFDQDHYTDFIDEYEVTYKTSIIDPSSYTKYVNGGTATFFCSECDTPLYSGMDACPQCGRSFNNTNKRNDLYKYEIEKFTASPRMKPEGAEHYFRLEKDFRDNYTLKYGGNDDDLYDRLSYDDSSNLLYYLTDGGYLFKSTIEEKNKKVLYKVPEFAGIFEYKLTVNDNGIFIVSKKSDPTAVIWLTKDGKEVKTIQLPGHIKQTYICGNLLLYIRTKADKKGNEEQYMNSAYYMSLSDEEEHCIFSAQKETIRKNVTTNRGNYKAIFAEQIFGNELGAIVQISAWYYDDADSVPHDQVMQEETDSWYYFDFERLSPVCLTAPKAGSHLLYNEPKKYIQWKEHCAEEGSSHNGLNIVGFDMEKNLMWVAMKKNGRDCKAPMNITADPKKRLRPDLPIWYEPKGKNAEHTGTFGGDRTYFDGKLCYVSSRDHFYAMNRAGECEDFPIKEYPTQLDGFSVQGGQIFVAGRLLLERMNIPVPPELQDTLDREYSALRFPAGLKFEKILGYSFYGFDNVFRHDRFEDEKRLKQEFDEGKTAAPTSADDDDFLKNSDWDEFFSKNENNEPEESAPSVQAATVNKPTNRLKYWAGFAVYAYDVLDSDMSLPNAADRNWYAIRLGSAKLRIECSVNSRAETLRTAFFVKEAPDIFAKLRQFESEISRVLSALGTVTWDVSSKSANVSLSVSQTGKTTHEQYEWFCNAANLLNRTIQSYLNT